MPNPAPVILVDRQDQITGHMEKLTAHQQGLLHRAISVVLINTDRLQPNQPTHNPLILLQKRQQGKYHSQELWSNACCSHPAPNESSAACAKRRLIEELNISTPLHYCGHFIYRARLDNGLIEHELDHVYLGYYQKTLPAPNQNEVSATRWVSYADIKQDLIDRPKQYTPWLGQVLQQALDNNPANDKKEQITIETVT